MFNAISRDAQKYVKSKCKEQNCQMKTGRHVSQRVIVDIEKYWIENLKRGKISDCLILCVFSSRKKLAIVELKGKSPDVSAVVEKIQNACNSIRDFLEETFLSQHDFDFYPILLSKTMSPIETKKLRASIICFQHQTEQLISEHCNASLEYVFQQYR